MSAGDRTSTPPVAGDTRASADQDTVAILLVEDDPSLRRGMRLNLEAEGYDVAEFETAEEAWDVLHRSPADSFALGIFDIRLSGTMDGLELCRLVRAAGHAFPLIMVTARGELSDRLAGFEAGVDDYIPKPFDLEELLARVRACLRRATPASVGTTGQGGGEADRWRIGEFLIDPEAASASRPSGETVRFNDREMNILRLLVEHRGRPVRRDEILDAVWGLEKYPTNRTIDNYIVKFRKIFEDDPRHPRLLLTRHGIGYELVRE